MNNELIKQLITKVALAVEKELPSKHGFFTVLVPMDKMDTSKTGIASNLKPEQMVEVLEGLLEVMKSKRFKPKDMLN